jgi:hypothetical protein
MVEFNTRDYELAHGCKPRGEDSWAFFFDARPDRRTFNKAWFADGFLTYGEAKKQARDEAARRRATRVYVAP